MKERTIKGKAKEEWEKERIEFFERKGIGRKDKEKMLEEIEEGEVWYGELERREKERQTEERWKKIRGSKYSKWYQWIKGEGIPEYLKKGCWKKKGRVKDG